MKRLLTIMAIIAALLPTIALASPSRPGDRGESGGSSRVLTIKKQSRDMSFESADESKRIELKVEVQGGVKPYTYTWYQGTLGDTDTSVSSRSEARIRITPGSYTYWARVTDRAGTTVDSNEIAVEFLVPGETPLAIKSQTGDLDVIAREGSKRVQLKVEAQGGTKPYDTIWYEGDSGDTSISIDSGSSISMDLIPGVYAYWAQVTDANGDVVDSSTINVNVTAEPLAFITEPANTNVVWRTATTSKAVLYVRARGGVAPYSYNWLLEGASVGTNPTLLVAFGAITDAPRNYSVEVTDANGDMITSRTAVVRIVVPAIKIISSTTSVTARWSGSDAVFSLSAAATGGAGALTYTWYSGTPTAPGAVVGTGRVASIRVSNASSGSFPYHLVVTDVAGTRAVSRIAMVRIPASIIPTATRTVVVPTATAVPPTATAEPTVAPTEVPTAEPTVAPTEVPTAEPTGAPTEVPTAEPTVAPTEVPTAEPTVAPTEVPTAEPTVAPTEVPTAEPTIMPTPFRITR